MEAWALQQFIIFYSAEIMINKKILLIDDDAGLLQLVSLIFKKAGAQVITAGEGLEGISKLFVHHPDLVILDVVMPGNNGFEVCRRIRQVSDAPIIMLTALNQEQEMLQGLDAGADDFLSKPFNPEILLARARTILRRTQQPNGNNGHNGNGNGNGNGKNGTFNYNDGHLSIDIEKHYVLRNGKRIKLTPIEFRLLVYLARNGGKLLTFENILSNVWGYDRGGSMDYIHVYISHLRRKIEENARAPRYIMTIHGVGYIFEKPELEYKR